MKERFVAPNNDQFNDELISELRIWIRQRAIRSRKEIVKESYAPVYPIDRQEMHFGVSWL